MSENPRTQTNDDCDFKSGVLIDDDSLCAHYWNHQGRNTGKQVKHYPDGESFLSEVKQYPEQYPKDTYIYVDWYLTSDSDSSDLIKEIHALGFENIVVTSNADLDLRDSPWIKKVISKDPPWNICEPKRGGSR